MHNGKTISFFLTNNVSDQTGVNTNNIIETTKLQFLDGQAAREHRRLLRLNQKDFWSRLGVTQSGGSRYESGREMPEPVQILCILLTEVINGRRACGVLEETSRVLASSVRKGEFHGPLPLVRRFRPLPRIP
jgi:DNA-binding transcriptional regulator YiaG